MSNSFDERLPEKLSREDQAFLSSLNDEPGLYAQMAGTFSGPLRLWTVFAFVLSLVFFGAAIFSVVKLAAFPPVGEAFLWLVATMWSVIALGLIKIWFWMRMNHVALLREIKKLELQIAQLRAG